MALYKENMRINWGTFLLGLICTLVFIFLILPIFIIIPLSFNSTRYLSFPPDSLSFRWYDNFFGDSQWIFATLRSFIIAFMTMIIATIIGSVASFSLARKKFRFKNFINIFLIAPIIVPLIIIAVGLFFIFSKFYLIDTIVGLIIAHSVLAIPLVIINVTATLINFDETYEFVSMNLGAGRVRTFFKVTLPLIKPGIISGAVFAFITSWDEIVIAIFICGTNAVTLPKKMWDGIRFEMDPTLAAISTMLIVITICLVVSIEIIKSLNSKKSL